MNKRIDELMDVLTAITIAAGLTISLLKYFDVWVM